MTIETCHNHHTSDLQDLADRAMPRAADLLARALGQPVTLSVNQVCACPASQGTVLLPLLVGDQPVSAVRQTFYGGLHGEALVVLDGPHRQQLEYLVDRAGLATPDHEGGLLCQGASLMASACLGGIGHGLRGEIVVGAPALEAAHVDAALLGQGWLGRMDTAACFELQLAIDGRVITAHLLLLLPAQEMERLSLLLDSFLSSR